MPSFPIVDSHVHLYDPSWLRYSWLQRVPKIDRRFDLADFDRCRAEIVVDDWCSRRSRSTQGCISRKRPGCRSWPTTIRG